MIFPENPVDGQSFLSPDGTLYTYEAMLRTWIQTLTGRIPLQTATTRTSGALSASDYRKLSRMLVPPPQSTLTVGDCTYDRGFIQLEAGDDNIVIKSKVSTQNIDEFGDNISQDYDFRIHSHTYGIDFSLNLESFLAEVAALGNFVFNGPDGPVGDVGPVGPAGQPSIFSGIPGDTGPPGKGTPCTYSVTPESYSASPNDGLSTVLTSAKLITDPKDSSKKVLSFTRQAVGAKAAQELVTSSSQSPWILAFDNSTGSNKINYVDIDQMLDSIYNHFVAQVLNLKTSYEAVVTAWVKNMSDMFDSQKAALGCALERCISLTKNVDNRQHMESVAAAALGKAKITLHNKDDSKAAKVKGTKSLQDIGFGFTPGCSGTDTFPETPKYGTSSGTTFNSVAGGLPPGSTNINDGGGINVAFAAQDAGGEPQRDIISYPVNIDVAYSNSVLTSVKTELPKGKYEATIKVAKSKVGKAFRSNVRFTYMLNNRKRYSSFLYKGEFTDPIDCRDVYEGLAVSFEHDGGVAEWWLPVEPGLLSSGKISIEVVPEKVFDIQKVMVGFCTMPFADAKKHERSWKNLSCDGCIVNMMGQDYAIISIDNDECECYNIFKPLGRVAFAFPTFNGIKLLLTGDFNFKFDEAINTVVKGMIKDGKMYRLTGNVDFDVVLFPS